MSTFSLGQLALVYPKGRREHRESVKFGFVETKLLTPNNTVFAYPILVLDDERREAYYQAFPPSDVIILTSRIIFQDRRPSGSAKYLEGRLIGITLWLVDNESRFVLVVEVETGNDEIEEYYVRPENVETRQIRMLRRQ